MVQLHPHDPQPGHHGPHPAISLIVGFGVIIAAAIVVHVVFGAVF